MTTLAQAQALGAAGFWVFELRELDKRPRREGWQDEATRTPTSWTPGSNIGIYTEKFGDDGQALVAVDIDVKTADGNASLFALEIEGFELPPTFEVQTPSGGRHLILVADRPVAPSVSKIGRAIDIRSARSYVVGPGSVLENGAYSPVNRIRPATAPAWLVERAGAPATRAAKPVDPSIARAVTYLKDAPASLEGEAGDLTAFRTAAKVKDMGVPRLIAFDLLAEHWNPRCQPPWELDDLLVKVNNAYRYGVLEAGIADPRTAFDVVQQVPGAVMPDYKRGEGGAIVATLSNIKAALDRPDQCGARIAFDTFRAEIMFAPVGTAQWRPMIDADYVRVRLRLEALGFRKVTTQDLRDVIQTIAEDQRFDSAVDWLVGLEWDQTPRVDEFFATCFGTVPGAYSTAVSRYWWTGLAGRVLAAPCQADMVPVLVGGQGIGKTQGTKAMAPAPEHFVELDLHARDDDLARKMRGVLVGEIGELRGLSSRDAESTKQWITRTEENWRQLYREFTTRYPRRLMMVATTNQDAFLADETGERRWLPMRSASVDIDAIKRDRDQLWAEGAALFREHGVLWQDALRLATDQHDDFKLGDVWSDGIERWLESFGDEPSPGGFPRAATWKRSTRPFRMSDLLYGALGIVAAGQTKAVEQRAAKVLKSLGYDKCKPYIDGKQVAAWGKRAAP